MNIVFKGSPNFTPSNASRIKRIVIHWFGVGTLESANARFQNAANQVSAHYGISKGRVWQWVKDENIAYHAGVWKDNKDTIGIEHDALASGQMLSEQDYQLSGQLVAQLAKKYNIKLSRSTVIGHRELKPTQCPGTVNIDRIISIAQGILQPMPIYPLVAKLKIVANKIDWATFNAQLQQFKDRIFANSGQKLQLDVVVENVAIDNIPYEDYTPNLRGPARSWYKNVITPKGQGFHFLMLLINGPDWQGSQGVADYAYFDDSTPQEMVVTAHENYTTGGNGNPDLPEFVNFAEHEMDHSIRQATGQETASDNPNLVHDYIARGMFNQILSTVDYEKLKVYLDQNGVQMLIYKFDDNATQYVLADDATLIGISSLVALNKTLKGRPQKLIVLPAAQRASFVIADSAIG